jgi:hypothetical protein
MATVTVEHDNKQFAINVRDVGAATRAMLASRAPNSLEAFADYESAEEIEQDDDTPEITEDIIDYFCLITKKVTDFDEQQLREMEVNLLIEISSAVLNELFGDDESDVSKHPRKRVTCSKEFFETVFAKDVGVISGMPDDATFVDVEYYPSTESFGLTFESDEWDVVSCIPEHEVVAVGDDIDGSWVSGY